MVKHKLDVVSCGLAGGDLEQYHTKGYLAFRPCSLVTGQLDAAARFTLHLAGKESRSLKPKLGDGYHFPELGITRSRIQDGFMNAWKESQAVHEIAINEEVRRAIAQLHGGRVAWPIQTKNWLIGSMTPAHADIIFYDTHYRGAGSSWAHGSLLRTSMPRRGHSSCGPRAIKRACGI